MRIEYVGHACLSIQTSSVRIATDPWFVGSSYCDQWHIFPKPVNASALQNSDVVLISHGHEDHFHEPSLKNLPKSAHVFYPYGWYGGAADFVRSLGFGQVTEALPEKKYQLGPNTTVTFIVNGMDSIMVIEDQGQVLVNINDALHSYPPKIIELFVALIKERWPVVDTLFCGFGGASYFPNTIHCDGKNDIEIGEAREEVFARNFCMIVHGIQPKVAVPFAADFALLHPKQAWINKVRFPRTELASYYQRLYGSENVPKIQAMYSGDALDDNEFERNSPYWNDLKTGEDLEHLISTQYAEESKTAQAEVFVDDATAESVRLAIIENIKFRSALFGKQTLANLQFTVKLSDLRSRPYFNVAVRYAEISVERAAERSPNSILQIESTTRILQYSFASDWGGDALTIGYGCDIQVLDPAVITSNLDTVCVRLLTRQPQASRHWRREPVRLVKHLLTSPTTRSWVTKSFLGAEEYSDKNTNDTFRKWLFRSKCEVCQACDLPLLNDTFAAKL
jgi:hypothetical protein